MSFSCPPHPQNLESNARSEILRRRCRRRTWRSQGEQPMPGVMVESRLLAYLDPEVEGDIGVRFTCSSVAEGVPWPLSAAVQRRDAGAGPW